ncbi:MAG: triose-phosphate isomerase [Anaerolineales bacterium]|nr:triose-phosphate isomerase [Anaerolineales bacterium]MCW5839012.1 triose-phosphate isomerase [Anaerolineales bacterium]
MARTPLIAGNWKMNKTVGEALRLVEEMLPGLHAVQGVETLLCPPAMALMPVAALLEGKGVALGAQNLHWEADGAFTGELSARMLAEFCQYVIVGHSERRALFGDTDLNVHRKLVAALAAGLTPVLCIGETLEQNEAGRAAEVLSGQLRAALEGVDIPSAQALVVAYEPVWAIGTGKAASPEPINTLLRNVVRPTLAGLLGQAVADEVRVLYGGSVNAGNAGEYFAQPEVDGALVGGASLKAADFVAITQAAA